MTKLKLLFPSLCIMLWSSFAEEQGLFSNEDLRLSANEAIALKDWSSAQNLFFEHSLASLKNNEKKTALNSFTQYLQASSQVAQIKAADTLKNYRLYLRNGGLDIIDLRIAMIQYLQNKKDYTNAENFLQSSKGDTAEKVQKLLELSAENSVYLGKTDDAIETYLKLIESNSDASSKQLDYHENLLLLKLSKLDWEAAQTTVSTQFAQGDLKKFYYELYIALGQKNLDLALVKFNALEEMEFETSDLPYSSNTFLHLQWQLRVKKQYSDALAVIEKLISSSDKENLNLLVLKADTLLENKKYDEALALYQSYVAEQTDTNWLAEAYLNIGHLLSIKKESTAQEEALTAYQKSFEISKNLSRYKIAYQASLHSAKLLKQAQRFEEALQAYTKASAISTDPEEKSLAFCLAGQLEFEQASLINNKEKFAQASVHFRKALELESSLHQQALLHYGFSMRASGLHDKALEAFNKLRATQFNAPESIYFQGLALIEAGQVLKGIKQLITLAQKHPEDPRVHNGLLSALKAATFKLKGQNRQNFSKKILEAYSKLGKNPGNAPFFLHLKALNSWYQNNDTQALQNWQNFASLYPEHPLAIEVQLWQAFSYYKSQNFDKALELYEFIENAYPENLLTHQALYQRSKINYTLKDYSKAGKLSQEFIKQYQEPLSKNLKGKSLNQAQFIYAQSLSHSRNFKEAELQFNKVIQGPDSDAKLQTLALAKLADNNYRASFKDRITKLESLTNAAQLYQNLAELHPKSQAQSLYKQALCHIKISQKSQDGVQKEKALEKASQILSKLIFQTQNVEKASPYYFARASYELGKIFIKNEQILSAKAVYQRLARSGIPGKQEAKIILEKLNSKKR